MGNFLSGQKRLQKKIVCKKKFQPSFCFLGRSPSNWYHVHHVCYDALAVMRKIESLQIWSGDYDLFSHSTRTLGCDQLLTWTSCLQYSAVDSRSRARESRPTAEILKRKKSAQLWWSVRTTLCETALRHRTLFNPPRSNCTAPKDSLRSWDQIDQTFDHYHLTPRLSQVDQVGWFEAAMFCSAPLCCHVVSPTHTTLLLSVWKPQGWAWTSLGTEMHKNADGFRGNYLLCNYMDSLCKWVLSSVFVEYIGRDQERISGKQ